ncbi:hypothetical protein K438DRAFT_2011951 [Mycena galopus ATCC 62051]|nr:hypothetical protein K438DRAFT_2011951 [Mycena galopus ATCC 62051]
MPYFSSQRTTRTFSSVIDPQLQRLQAPIVRQPRPPPTPNPPPNPTLTPNPNPQLQPLPAKPKTTKRKNVDLVQKRLASIQQTVDQPPITRAHASSNTKPHYAYTWEALSPSQKELVKKVIFIDQVHWEKFQNTPLHEACTAVDKEFANEYKKWNATYQKKVITPRLKLRGVYKTTGLHLILDPFWTVGNLKTGKPTKEFLEILKTLQDNCSTDDKNTLLPVARYEGNHSAALGVLQAFDESLYRYATAIYDRCPTDAAVIRRALKDAARKQPQQEEQQQQEQEQEQLET